MSRHADNRPRRCGVSLVEAMVAVSVTTIAGAALLTALGGAVQSSQETQLRSVARGLASQMMAEIAATRFPVGSDVPPSGGTRADFDDYDDYDGWRSSPPVTRDGTPVGTEGVDRPRPEQLQADAVFVSHLLRAVTVEVVQPVSGGWQVSSTETGFRRITVRVFHVGADGNQKPLAEQTRILARVQLNP